MAFKRSGVRSPSAPQGLLEIQNEIYHISRSGNFIMDFVLFFQTPEKCSPEATEENSGTNAETT